MADSFVQMYDVSCVEVVYGTGMYIQLPYV